jgi:hypothetical protein
VGGDILIDSETLLLTDFMNLKIKPTQSFKGAHRDNMCICVFICVSGHTCINSCIYTMFLKNTFLPSLPLTRIMELVSTHENFVIMVRPSVAGHHIDHTFMTC